MCSECSEFFYLDQELEAHLNLEHGFKTDKNYCKKCRIGYKDVHNCTLEANKIKYGEERKRYHCTQCDKSFRHQVHLKHHIRTLHEKRLDYSCEECGKRLGSSKV